MMASATRKVPGGKLLRVHADVEDGIIRSVQISGDFFLHPEEVIEDIESVFSGASVENLDNISRLLKEKTKDAVFIGIAPEDIIEVLKEALRYGMAAD